MVALLVGLGFNLYCRLILRLVSTPISSAKCYGLVTHKTVRILSTLAG